MPPIKEREEARKERQLQKEKKKKRIIWIAIIVVAVILIIMKAFELNLGSIKNQIASSDGTISVSTTYPMTLDSSNVKVESMNDKLSFLTSTSVSILNLNNDDMIYSFAHGFANPVMSKNGNYFCLIDQGSNRLRLDTVKENTYEMNTESTVLCADVSRNGTVVYATQGADTKSSVFVMNKNQIEKMKLDINDGYVISTAIDNSGSRFAVAMVNSKDAKLVTTVSTYNVGKQEPIASFDFVGTNLLDMNYSSTNDLYVVGTNFVSVITNQKKQRVAFDIGEINTNCFSYTDNGELVLAYSKYEGAIENTLAYINGAGKVKLSLDLPQRAKYVSSASNNVTVLFNDKIVTYSLKNGKEKDSTSCDDTVTTANRLSSKVFVTREQLIDVIG